MDQRVGVFSMRTEIQRRSKTDKQIKTTYTHPRGHTHTNTNTHTQGHTHTQSHTRIHPYTQGHTHSHTHTHTHTHTHPAETKIPNHGSKVGQLINSYMLSLLFPYIRKCYFSHSSICISFGKEEV